MYNPILKLLSTSLKFAFIEGNQYNLSKMSPKRNGEPPKQPNPKRTKESLLLEATLKGYLDVVKKVLENGVDSNTKDKNGNSPLHLAASKSNVEIIKELLKRGANVHATNDNVETPLLCASSYAPREIICLLIQNGASVNVEDCDGATPLHLAIGQRNFSIIEDLLENGADPNAIDSEHFKPIEDLQLTEYENDEEEEKKVIEALIKYGGNISTPREKLLFDAIGTKKIAIVELLFQNGANIMAESEIGNGSFNTPIWQWVADSENALTENKNGQDMEKFEAIAKILIKYGANIEEQEEYAGQTPLHCIRVPAVAKVLISFGANVNARDENDTTPLHNAVKYEKLELIKLLLQKGAEINALTKRGHSPIQYCNFESEDAYEIASILVKHGANLRPMETRSPIFNAIFAKNVPVVELFVKNGVDVNARRINLDCNMNRTALHTIAYLTEMEDEFYFEDYEDYGGEEELLEAYNKRMRLNLSTKICNDHVCEKAHQCIGQPDVNGDNTESDNEEGEEDDLELEKCRKILKILLENGADVTATDEDGKTPLYITDDPKCVAKLLDHGANINAQDNKGSTRLHKAAAKEQMTILKMLLKRGADVHLKRNTGLSTLEKAVKEQSIFVVKEIVNHIKIEKNDEIIKLLNGVANLPKTFKSIKEIRQVQAMVKAKMFAITNCRGEEIDISHY